MMMMGDDDNNNYLLDIPDEWGRLNKKCRLRLP